MKRVGKSKANKQRNSRIVQQHRPAADPRSDERFAGSMKLGGAVAGAITLVSVLNADPVCALPQNYTLAGGAATVDAVPPGGSSLTVNQNSTKAILNWQSFDIGAGESVTFAQPNNSSVMLNRVTGGNLSQILGQLNANGQVWVINPGGVLVGPGATVQTGSFLASTLNISNENFMAGNYVFTGAAGSLATIINEGNIRADGGYVVLAAPSVTNNGLIAANLGKVQLASGAAVSVNIAGNDLIGLVVTDAAAADALGVSNSGRISAEGGQVVLTAKVASALLKTVVNNSGVVEAQSITSENGVIILDGGSGITSNSGTLDASGTAPGESGGAVDMLGAKVLMAAGSSVKVEGKVAAGTVNVTATDITLGGTFSAGTVNLNYLHELDLKSAAYNVQAATVNANGTATSSVLGPNSTATWTVSGGNTGSVVSAEGTVKLAGFGKLKGGDASDVFQIKAAATADLSGGGGDDSFTFWALGTVDGDVDGGDGTDSLTLTPKSGAVSVNRQTSEATGISGTYSGIERLIGNGINTTLIGADVGESFAITDANTGTVGTPGAGDELAFTGVGNVRGGSGADSFVFADEGLITGNLHGGGGSDTVDLSAKVGAVSIDQGSRTATGIGGTYSWIEKVIGNGVNTTLIGVDQGQTFNITGADSGKAGGMSFTEVGNLTGRSGDDSFVVALAGRLTGKIDGSGGANTVAAAGGNNTWQVTGDKTGSLNGSTRFTGITNLAGGSGTDTLVTANDLASTALSDSTLSRTGLSDMVLSAMDAAELTGGAGANAIDVSTWSGTAAINMTAGSDNIVGNGVKTTLNGLNSAVTFAINTKDTGTAGDTTFTDVGNLTGGSGNDSFAFADAGSLTGKLDGGGGTDTLNLSGKSGAVTVDRQTARATGIGETFSGIEKLAGNGLGTTLVGLDAGESFAVTGTNSGTVGADGAEGGLAFTGVDNLKGGSGTDSFVFTNGGSLAGDLYGGGGTDTLDLSARTGLVSVDRRTATTTVIDKNFIGIETLKGNGGNTLLIGTDAGESFAITGTNSGTVGADGDGGLAFTGVGKLMGGSGADSFVIADAGRLTGNLHGGDGVDSLDLSGKAGPVSIDQQERKVTGVDGNFSGIEAVVGNGVNTTLTGVDAGENFYVDGRDSGRAGGLSFREVGNLTGGSGDDRFVVAVTGSLTGIINGGGGANTVAAASAPNSWQITGDKSGTLNGTTRFKEITTLAGGSRADTLLIADDLASITLGNNTLSRTGLSDISLSGMDAAKLTGGAGDNAIDVSAWSGTAAISITAGSDAVVGNGIKTTLAGGPEGATFKVTGARKGNVDDTTFDNVGTLRGGLGNDRFVLGAAVPSFNGTITGGGGSDTVAATEGDNAWRVTGENAGTLNVSTVFSGISNLEGGSGDDTFRLASGVGTFDGVITGGGGGDTLAATNGDNAWHLSGAKAGTLNDSTFFSGITNLAGGIGADTFRLASGLRTFDGVITGGGGTDTVAATDGDNDWKVTGTKAGSLNDSTLFSGITKLEGGNSADTLTGLAAGSTWTITGTKKVTVSAMNGSSMDALVGGTGADTFTLASGVKSFEGTITGGGGTDKLGATDGDNDWAVTGINAGILNDSTIFSGITKLAGGNGMDTLTGLAAGSSWGISGAKAVTVSAMNGSSMDALVGGTGADTFRLASRVLSFNGAITGGGGTDTLGATDGVNDWKVNGSNAGILNVSTVFSGITNLGGGSGADTFTLAPGVRSFYGTVTGGGGNDTVAVTDGDNVWQVTGAKAGTLNDSTVFSGISNLVGGSGADNFTLASGVETFDGAITGGGGTDTLVATNGENYWQVTGENSGTLNVSTVFNGITNLAGGSDKDTLTGLAAGSSWGISAAKAVSVSKMNGSSMDALVGGTGADTFTLASRVETFDGAITGGGGTDTLAATDGDNDWQVTGEKAGSLNDSTVFSGISNLKGGSGIDTLAARSVAEFRRRITNLPGGGIDTPTGLATGSAWEITGAKTVMVSAMNGTSMDALVGGTGADTFTLASGVETFVGEIIGGGGTDTLAATNGDNDWEVTGGNSGTLNDSTVFSGITNLAGGSGVDTLTGLAAGSIWGISGAKTLTVSAMNGTSMDVLVGGTGADTFTLASEVQTFDGEIIGGGGTDTLAATDGENHWLVTGGNAGTLNASTVFSGISNLAGGSWIDTLTGLTAGSTWDISGAKAVTVSAMYGSSMDALVGGTGLDTFTLASGVQTFDGAISGGGGTDTLAATDGENHWQVTGENAGTLNRSTVFSGITNLSGGHWIDTLTGLDAGSAWGISGAKAVMVSAMNGTSIDVLRGGAGSDTFTLASGVESFEGAITGGGGNDTLAATDGENHWRVTGEQAGRLNDSTFLSEIANLSGGDGDDRFVFADAGSVTGNLAGGAGANTLELNDKEGTVSIDLPAAKATGIGGNFSGISGVVGNGVNTTLTAAGQTFAINGIDSGKAGAVDFTGVGNLEGLGADTFIGAESGRLTGTIVARGPVTLSGAITTAGLQEYKGAATLGADTVLTSQNSGDITMTQTVDGAYSLKVNTGGVTTFGGAVGSGTALSSLATDAAGSTYLNGAIVTTSGSQRYDDDVTLGARTTLTTTVSGDIGFGKTVNSVQETAQDLTVKAKGNSTFEGSVGNTAALANVKVDSADTATLDGETSVTTLDVVARNIKIKNSVNAGSVTVTAQASEEGSGGDIEIAKTISAQSVTLTASGNLTGAGSVSGTDGVYLKAYTIGSETDPFGISGPVWSTVELTSSDNKTLGYLEGTVPDQDNESYTPNSDNGLVRINGRYVGGGKNFSTFEEVNNLFSEFASMAVSQAVLEKMLLLASFEEFFAVAPKETVMEAEAALRPAPALQFLSGTTPKGTSCTIIKAK